MLILTKAQQVVGLVVWFFVCFAVAAVGAAASIQARSFYAQLTQPSWAPPGWLFGPVWTCLYGLIALAAWRVWRRGGLSAQARPLLLFMIQLALNGLWSWLFFAWHMGAFAFVDIIVLWLMILLTIVCFWRTDRIAGYLLVPYFLWVSFALVLNYSIWQLNPLLLN